MRGLRIVVALIVLLGRYFLLLASNTFSGNS